MLGSSCRSCRRGLLLLAPLPLLLLLLGPAPARGEEERASEADARRREGQRLLAEGRPEQARHFLLEALALAPDSLDVLGDLLRTSPDDAQAVALWLHHAASVGTDEKGRFKPPRSWPDVPREALRDAQALLDLRGDALRAIERAASGLKGGRDASLARYLTRLQRALARDAHRLGAPSAEALAKAESACPPDSEKVVQALHKLARKLLAQHAYADALEAARILRGLNQQEKQAPGAAAGVGTGLPAAISVERAARKALAEEGEKVHTLEELEAVPEEERDAWSRAHATWARPGVAVSPGGLYRLETVCGLETLLVATTDVERHHRRLASWYGQDPFAERQGLVRLCPDPTDMESAGQPFWWAGGFQSGDLTTVLAAFTSRHGLAGLLTHELTHRFDATLLPGLPAWLMEGRAVYTAVCTVDPHAPTLDERRVSFGQFWQAGVRGYARPENLERLLGGTIDDYRDNYDAGYVLWVFLKRFAGFEDEARGEPLFAPRLDDYLHGFGKRRNTDPMERFASSFLDGKDGRPDGWEALGPIWSRFVREGSALEPPPWRIAWQEASNEATRAFKDRAPAMPIDDRATWHLGRSRSDPVAYGEEHAYAAGRLLERHGDAARALDAFAWALQVDEPRADRCAHAGELARSAGEPAEAWVAQLEAHRLDPGAHPAPGGAPPGPLAEVGRRVQAFLQAQERLEEVARASSRTRLARALRADRARIGLELGLPESSPEEEAVARPPSGEPPPPDCPPYVGELVRGVEEVRWSPLDSEAHGLWNQPDEARLELGRRQSADATTGSALRDAGVRRVFVRANAWHAGTYTFRTRVRFLSAHVTARLVLGCTRNDRGVEIRIGGGDFAYATGRKEEALELRSVHVALSDLRTFDESAGTLGRSVPFATPREAFTVTVRVAGPYVRVEVEDEVVLVHRRSTGDPIEGRVGFGLGSGLVRFEDPATRHHRVLGSDHACPCGAHDEPIRLDQPLEIPWETCVGRRVEGVPLHPSGTLVLWYTAATPVLDRPTPTIQGHVARLLEPFVQARLPVAVHLLLPPAAGEEDDGFDRSARFGLDEGHVRVHAGAPSLVRLLEARIEERAQREQEGPRKVPLDLARTKARRELLGQPAWLMLDDHGVVRTTSTVGNLGQATALAHHLTGW